MSQIDIPKENWGTRPAVVLDIVDRLTYQALVDRQSLDLIGRMSANVFGWRLRATGAARGVYSHNDQQWKGYREHLSIAAALNSVVLRTDLVSFFASIPPEPIQESIQDRTSKSVVTDRLCDLVGSFAQTPGRSGLVQRSTASAVLANMYLEPLDAILLHYSKPLPRLFRSGIKYDSFSRWMDDILLFGGDPARARRAQMDLQAEAQSLGLNLNFAKTEVLEGPDVGQVLDIQHSAIDFAIAKKNDFIPLEELIDSLIENPETAGHSSIRFAAKRMRDHNSMRKSTELLSSAPRMPHAADALTRLFKKAFIPASLTDWFLWYAGSDWATHEWSTAWYGRLFPSNMRTRKVLREFFAERIRDANTSLPLLALACQRLSVWDPIEARAAFNDSLKRVSTPHACRIIALAALSVGESRTRIRKWLSVDAENEPTLLMLEDWGWNGPRVRKDYSD